MNSARERIPSRMPTPYEGCTYIQYETYEQMTDTKSFDSTPKSKSYKARCNGTDSNVDGRSEQPIAFGILDHS